MESINTYVSNIPPTNATQTVVSEENDSELATSVRETYSCPYTQCSFTSTWKSSLSMHLKSHTDERPWQCALCNKHFKLKHHLKHHILTHSQHKPFKCNLCEYRSSDNHSLQRHKVNKHRLTSKRKPNIKRLSLPTMVSLSSSASFATTPEALLTNFLERHQSISGSSGVATNFQTPLITTVTPQTSSRSNSLSSISQALMQQQMQCANNLSNQRVKIMNVRSVSDSQYPSESQNTSQPPVENDPIIVLSDEQEKTIEVPSISSPESISLAVKEETSLDRESCESSLHRTPNSHQSFEYVHGGRISVDSMVGKLPSHRKSSSDYRSELSANSDLPVFEQSANHCALQNSTTERQNNSRDEDRLSKNERSVKWRCSHCDIIFPDNIMYGLHMGCHSVGSSFQCNICGLKCKDSHDFMFHFTIGKHLS